MDLSMETKTKIITMRKYSSATFTEIANQCGCGVSRKILWTAKTIGKDLNMRFVTSIRFDCNSGYFRISSSCSLCPFVYFVLKCCIQKESTARKWWKRYEKENDINVKPRSGRPQSLNSEIKANIIERIHQNPSLTAVSFAREHNVSRPTISAVFKENGLNCYTAATQTRLTEQHRINRLAFCRKMLDEWDETRLQNIIFSDEKTFCTDVSWRSKVYRPFNSRYEPPYVKTTSRSGRVTNNYWGAIGKEGPVTDIVRIVGKFNSDQYLRILRNHVLPTMRSFSPPRIFMQDNSPVHKSKRCMAWFSRQTFELLEWPALSPDLNPIENVWSFMENGWPQIHPRNSETLDQVVQERWSGLRNNQGELL